jgi:trigger factor
MKKENKRLAQERRAEERRKKEQQDKVKGILAIAIPVVIVLLLLAWIIGDAVTNKSSDSASGTEAASTQDTTVSDETDVDTDAEDTTDDAAAEDGGLYTGTDIAVADGDTVNIDYVGYVDGEAFDGGNTQGYGTDLTIGSGSYIDDFEEQLIGHYVGETVEVKVTFPDPYTNTEDLSGKEAVFETVINGIYQ